MIVSIGNEGWRRITEWLELWLVEAFCISPPLPGQMNVFLMWKQKMVISEISYYLWISQRSWNYGLKEKPGSDQHDQGLLFRQITEIIERVRSNNEGICSLWCHIQHYKVTSPQEHPMNGNYLTNHLFHLVSILVEISSLKRRIVSLQYLHKQHGKHVLISWTSI